MRRPSLGRSAPNLPNLSNPPPALVLEESPRAVHTQPQRSPALAMGSVGSVASKFGTRTDMWCGRPASLLSERYGRCSVNKTLRSGPHPPTLCDTETCNEVGRTPRTVYSPQVDKYGRNAVLRSSVERPAGFLLKFSQKASYYFFSSRPPTIRVSGTGVGRIPPRLRCETLHSLLLGGVNDVSPPCVSTTASPLLLLHNRTRLQRPECASDRIPCETLPRLSRCLHQESIY